MADSVTAPTDSNDREHRRGAETILVVDDDRKILVVICNALRKYGFEVLEAQSGADALTLCEQHPGAIDLLLSDVVLARMSGPQVAARIATSRPGMKVLYMSGHGASSMFASAIQASGARMLQKPFTADVLVRHVREVLDTEPTIPSSVETTQSK